jgi:hypothetical protein
MTTLITVAPRYTRSINVERDALLASAVEGYVLTNTPGEIVRRFVRSLAVPTGHRALNITGPYGTGKSAFAVFISNMLGSPRQSSTMARCAFAKQAPDLCAELFDRRKKTAFPKWVLFSRVRCRG